MTEELVRTLLANRGVEDENEKEIFLNPDYETGLHDPFLMKDMDKAISRFLDAISKNERIVIFTDYDTDGLPAAAMFHDFFKKIEYENFENYIPHRHGEGFGLNKQAIDTLKKNNAALLLTADCGITNHEEVEHARTLDIDVIITDHHLPRDKAGEVSEDLPKAYAILNPHQKGDEYPFKELCGCGVAFKFLQGVIQKGKEKEIFDIHDGWEKWLLDMVAIATVSDMVPLVGENRVLAHFGLKVLRKSPRPGLMRLFRNLYINQRFLTEDDIGFVIGPRINAASRMDDPVLGFNFLSERDETAALETLKQLNRLNDKRKGVVAGIVKEARKKINRDEIKEIIVAGNPNWQPGVLGLAANTLSKEFERPVFLWGRLGSPIIRGSCRSDGSIHVVEFMQGVEGDVFSDFGGHERAGGFTIHNEKIHTFEEALLRARELVPKYTSEQKDKPVDTTLLLDEVNERTLSAVEQLAPFGMGNPKPIFLFENIKIHDIQFFGKEKNHMTFLFKNNDDKIVSAISFFADKKLTDFKEGERVTLTVHMERNGFRGSREPRLRLVDIRRT
ncbi:single-stranded-DNA-specific exonuclease RecJ [bacterium]|nr:single-stranded-DNA-specific exonuclease RecJ [bacterium]|tara:strand:- start:26688 stop:28367 length:1680 start_codon:yes stop_codon:yes gene_type:complete